MILNVKYNNGSSQHGILNAMVVGLSLYGMVNLIGGISGCCVNPAIGLIQTAFARIMYEDEATLYNLVSPAMFAFYTLAPALGGIFAGLF